MKKLFFTLPFLLAGCQAERVAFQFQPVPPASGVAPAGSARPLAAAARNQEASGAILTNKPSDYKELRAESAFQPRKLSPRQQRRTALAVPARATIAQVPPAVAAATLDAPAKPILVAPKSLIDKLLTQRLLRRRATAGPAHTTENGLGGVALFFIGVFLAVLAGLGALVSLIFGTGFFAGVGFAAAGLVVLFLLYKLVSGGGKHQPKPAK